MLQGFSLPRSDGDEECEKEGRGERGLGAGARGKVRLHVRLLLVGLHGVDNRLRALVTTTGYEPLALHAPIRAAPTH